MFENIEDVDVEESSILKAQMLSKMKQEKVGIA
jgi:hypothetical protein